MSKAKRTSIEVQGASIAILSHDRQDFLCLTDTNQKKLGSTLWGIADQLRWAMPMNT